MLTEGTLETRLKPTANLTYLYVNNEKVNYEDFGFTFVMSPYTSHSYSHPFRRIDYENTEGLTGSVIDYFSNILAIVHSNNDENEGIISFNLSEISSIANGNSDIVYQNIRQIVNALSPSFTFLDIDEEGSHDVDFISSQLVHAIIEL